MKTYWQNNKCAKNGTRSCFGNVLKNVVGVNLLILNFERDMNVHIDFTKICILLFLCK